jgi:hypothetical protein
LRIHEKFLLLSSRHVRPSVRLSARIIPPPAGRIFVKFDIEDFHENLSRKNLFWVKTDKNIGHFTETQVNFVLTGEIESP